MTFRLAMLDVDGTLKREATWLPGALELVDALAAAGLTVALCSGREASSLESLAADLPAVTMLAGAGGSIVRVRTDAGWRTVGDRFLDADFVSWMDTETRRLGGELWAYTDTRWVIRERTARVEFDETFTHATATVGELGGRDDVVKLLMFCDSEPLEELRDRAAEWAGVGVASSYPGYWDLIPQGSLDTKGGDFLTAATRCSWAETLAAGDGSNDAGMLSHAGLAYLLEPRRVSELHAAEPGQERVEVADIAAVAADLRRRGII